MINQRLILDSIDSGLAVIDENLKIYEWNSWLECATGIKSEDATFAKLDELIYIEPIKLETLKRNINTSLKLNITTFMTPNIYGYLIDIPIKNLMSTSYAKMQQEIKIIPIDLENKKLCLFISDQTATMDTQKQLTKQIELEVEKRLFIEMERQNERELLIQSDKMAQLGNMLGAIIHQWKQPLNSIALYAQHTQQLLNVNVLDRIEMRDNLKSIMLNIDFMSKTADNFKDFYKPTKKKKAFNIRRQIELVVELLSEQLRLSSINLSIVGGEDIIVFGYPNEFKQVTLNIINNAKGAFMEKGILGGKISINISLDAKTVTVNFTDNAGGIPTDLLPDKLFMPFISTKGDEGTGIGLSVSRIIIEENMGGAISAENTDDGAMFIIKLPILDLA